MTPKISIILTELEGDLLIINAKYICKEIFILQEY